MVVDDDMVGVAEPLVVRVSKTRQFLGIEERSSFGFQARSFCSILIQGGIVRSGWSEGL